VIVSEGSPYLAVIPARAGSKRVPGKNIRPIAGRPLLAWSIEHVRRCATPMRVLVSTDDPQIREVALEAGAEVPELRPKSLATDESPTEPAILHALDSLPGKTAIEHVVLLPPTSPIRDDGSIDAAIEFYESSGSDCLVSVTPESPLLWRGTPEQPMPLYDVSDRPRQQCVAEDLRRYRENGSIVITSVPALRRTGNRLGGKAVMYVMGAHEGIDVDSEYDLWLAEQWLRSKHAD
jgi:CMP-N,N'-diacetyllegionaminic acid synthase